MKKVLSPKILDQILKISISRYESIFQKKITQRIIQLEKRKIQKTFNEDLLFYKLNSRGKLVYCFRCKKDFRGDFDAEVLQIKNIYCSADKSNRLEFYKSINKKALELKKSLKVKLILIDIDAYDTESIKHFTKKGKLTSVELIGKVYEGLKILEDINLDKNIKVSLLQKKHIKDLVKLELNAHAKDISSRMHEIFKKPGAKKLTTDFYLRLWKRKSMFVAFIDNKLAGSTGYFEDEKNKIGLVATIFVSNEFKGRGVSKILYKNLLTEFKRRKYKYYLGGSTTDAVLAFGAKIGRKPISYSYIMSF